MFVIRQYPMKHVLYHMHKRRQNADAEHTPRSEMLGFLDSIALANGIIGSLTPIPQIYTILSTGRAEGVSSLTWELLTATSIIWLSYGIIHRDRPIMSSSAISIVLYLMVIAAAAHVS